MGYVRERQDGDVGGPPIVKAKASNETVTSSTTLQDDDDLVQAIGANETWVFEFTLYVSGAAAGDILPDVAAPAGATGFWGVLGAALGNTTDQSSVRIRAADTLSSTGITLGIIDAVTNVARITATVFNGANAGNVKLRWAQGTSNATGTVVHAGSVMKAHRIV